MDPRVLTQAVRDGVRDGLKPAGEAPPTYFVTLSSSAVQQPANRFTTALPSALELSGGRWSCALVGVALWWTAFNVNAASRNTDFDFYDGTSWHTGSLRPGSYNAIALIQAIYDEIATLTSTTIADSITLTVDESVLGFYLVLKDGCEVDFSAGGSSRLNIMLGFAAGVISGPQDERIYAPNQANISDISSLQIRCSAVQSYTNGIPGSTLYTVTPSVGPGALYAVNPAYPVFVPVGGTSISSISIEIVDQDGRPVDFNCGDFPFETNPASVSLLFRRDS